MNELKTMMWKEVSELFGNRRFIVVFIIAILAMGVLPALSFSRNANALGSLTTIFFLIYVLLATVIVTANTAPDLVLHERVGHTLDYLLTTRLSDRAIFGGKVLTAVVVGYVGSLIAIGVQLLASALVSGQGLHWLYLSLPAGRVLAFGMTAGLSLYVSVVGTFVALRVGEQRAAYMVTMLSVGLLMVPFLAGWLHIALTLQWTAHAAIWVGVIALALNAIGVRLFRREMLVLYLQE